NHGVDANHGCSRSFAIPNSFRKDYRFIPGNPYVRARIEAATADRYMHHRVGDPLWTTATASPRCGYSSSLGAWLWAWPGSTSSTGPNLSLRLSLRHGGRANAKPGERRSLIFERRPPSLWL